MISYVNPTPLLSSTPPYTTTTTTPYLSTPRLSLNTTNIFRRNKKRIGFIVCLFLSTTIILILLFSHLRTLTTLSSQLNGISSTQQLPQQGGGGTTVIDRIKFIDDDDDLDDQAAATVPIEDGLNEELGQEEKITFTKPKSTFIRKPKPIVTESLSQSNTSSTTATTNGTLLVSALPIPRRPSGDPSERFIGYLPHSGYHNQRGELQNALILGKLLNRTVLIPPVWIGWPTPTELYEELQQSWTLTTQTHLNSFQLAAASSSSLSLSLPGDYNASAGTFPMKTAAEIEEDRLHDLRLKEVAAIKWKGFEMRSDGYPITNLTEKECKSYSAACRHTYKDTFLSWDFLVDLSEASHIVPVIDRWDIRERSIENLLNVTSKDIYVIRDKIRYDFQFSTKGSPKDPLLSNLVESQFARRISIPALSTLPHRVILIGSLFGSNRITTSPSIVQSTEEKNQATELRSLKSSISRSLAFRNPILSIPADEIRDRLGGSDGYIGVHARIGDGEFEKLKELNMRDVWWRIVKRLDLGWGVADEMWERVKPSIQRSRLRRQEEEEASNEAQKRHSNRGKRAPPPLPVIHSASNLNHLTCRSSLHTEAWLQPFNTPVYLATDSRSPTTDPILAIFFASFPCTFILSDFEGSTALNHHRPVTSVALMKSAVNKHDAVPLGRLFLPFLEAMIAAKCVMTIGTKGSTFSGFAETGLRDAYRMDWESGR